MGWPLSTQSTKEENGGSFLETYVRHLLIVEIPEGSSSLQRLEANRVKRAHADLTVFGRVGQQPLDVPHCGGSGGGGEDRLWRDYPVIHEPSDPVDHSRGLTRTRDGKYQSRAV